MMGEGGGWRSAVKMYLKSTVITYAGGFLELNLLPDIGNIREFNLI